MCLYLHKDKQEVEKCYVQVMKGDGMNGDRGYQDFLEHIFFIMISETFKCKTIIKIELKQEGNTSLFFFFFFLSTYFVLGIMPKSFTCVRHSLFGFFIF